MRLRLRGGGEPEGHGREHDATAAKHHGLSRGRSDEAGELRSNARSATWSAQIVDREQRRTASARRFCFSRGAVVPQMQACFRSPLDPVSASARHVVLVPTEVLGPLGAGGMGEVYRARDTSLATRRRHQGLCHPAFVQDPDRFARFEREARLLAVAQPSQYRGHLRRRRVDGGRRTRARAHRRADACRPASSAARLPVARGAVDRARQIARPSKRRTSRHRPSRPQASQHQGHARRRREGAGLRPGQRQRRGIATPISAQSPTMTSAGTARE